MFAWDIRPPLRSCLYLRRIVCRKKGKRLPEIQEKGNGDPNFLNPQTSLPLNVHPARQSGNCSPAQKNMFMMIHMQEFREQMR